MSRILLFISCVFIFSSCKKKTEKTKPVIASITESVYASGSIKSKDQYQAFVSVNGIIDNIFVKEGDLVKKDEPLLTVSNETQHLNKENAQLAVEYADLSANQGKLEEARLFVQLSKNKMLNDSLMYYRQTSLWKQQVGTKVELEQRALSYENSKTNYYSALVKYTDLKRQLDFVFSQSKKNLYITQHLENDYILRSQLDGILYNLFKSKGEIVGPQIPIAVIGSANEFILEMQVDEFDILKIRKGQVVLVTMDSYKGKVFEGKITRVYPFMNERSRTFTVEAEFVHPPDLLYPNITFEANIVLRSKNKALLIPRNYLVNDSTVINSQGMKTRVKTGLKDYQKAEILSGIGVDDELLKPEE